MAKNQIAEMEAERIAACREKDAYEYYSLSKRLGYSPEAVEDPDLFQEGYKISRDCSHDLSCVSKLAPERPVVDNRTLVKALNVTAPRLPYFPGTNYIPEENVRKRLRDLARTGYPVRIPEGLGDFELLRFYDKLKHRIINLAMVNVPAAAREIFSKNRR